MQIYRKRVYCLFSLRFFFILLDFIFIYVFVITICVSRLHETCLLPISTCFFSYLFNFVYLTWFHIYLLFYHNHLLQSSHSLPLFIPTSTIIITTTISTKIGPAPRTGVQSEAPFRRAVGSFYESIKTYKNQTRRIATFPSQGYSERERWKVQLLWYTVQETKRRRII